MTSSSEPPRLPPGRPPWDPINGLRVGGLAGAVVGIVITAVIGARTPWIAIVAALVGGAVGYLGERRKQRLG